MAQIETMNQETSTSNNPLKRGWGFYQSLSKFMRVSVVVLALIIVSSPFLIANQTLFTHASGSTVTVTANPIGTIQTQLSTNLVQFAGDLSAFPNGQADLNSLVMPLVRLHMGDDGGDNMPELKPGSWSMTGIDQMVSEVYASGQQPLMNIKFAPDYMWTCYPNSQAFVSNPGSGFVSDTSFQQFAQYMARLVSYYNKGSLTEENGTVLTNPAGTSHKITYWELWNEPEGDWETPCKTPQQNDVALTEPQYLTMWNAVSTAMLAVDPTIKLIGPTAANAYTSDGYPTTTGNAYIDTIMTKGVNKPYALSFHNYGWWESGRPDKTYFDGDGSGNGGQGITDMVTMAQKLHQTYPTTPIWLTEVNVNSDWGAAGQNDDELSVAWWGAGFAQLAPLGVSMIHQYDFTGANLFGLVDGEGVTVNGSTKDATGKPMLPYYVVQQFDKAFPQGSTILSSSSVQPGILSLAVQKPDGTVSVMIVNRELVSNTAASSCGTGGVATSVTVDLSALNPTDITLTQLDKRNIDCSTWYGIAPTTTAIPTAQPVTISFPGYGIAILNVATNGAVFPTATPAPIVSPSPTTGAGPSPTPKPTSAPAATPTAGPSPTPRPVGSGPAWIQGAYKSPGASTATPTVTLNNVQAGDLLVVSLNIGAGVHQAATGVTNTGAATLNWTNVVSRATSNSSVYLWYAFASASGSYTITGNAASSTSDGIAVNEYNGVDQTSPVLTTGAANASSSSPTVSGTTSIPANSLVVGSSSWDSGNPTVTSGSGFTLRQVYSNATIDTSIAVEDTITGAAGAPSANWTLSTSPAWTADLVAFAAAAGVGGFPTAAPTNTPVAPTNTPVPTSTPIVSPTPTPLPTYSIIGSVYNDANQNGFQDAGEPSYQGATVMLSNGQSATTDIYGNYTFANETQNTYTVTLKMPAGYTSTTTNPVSISLTANTTVNFGIVQTPTLTIQDSSAPTVLINSPVAGGTIRHGSLLTVTGSSTDNVGVVNVIVKANGGQVCTATLSNPNATSTNYTCSFYLTNKKNVLYNLVAYAYDLAGNIGNSTTVTVKTSN